MLLVVVVVVLFLVLALTWCCVGVGGAVDLYWCWVFGVGCFDFQKNHNRSSRRILSCIVLSCLVLPCL